MSVQPLTEHHLEFLSLNRGCTGSSESTLVKCHIVGNYMSWLIFLFPESLRSDREHGEYTERTSGNQRTVAQSEEKVTRATIT